VVQDQLPILEGRFGVGVASCGANDYADLDTERFATQMRQVCQALSRHADVVAVATLPLSRRVASLSWRRTVLLTRRLNEQIRTAARACDVVLIELEPALIGPWSMAPDAQHPTSLGQLEVARVAAVALDSAGVRFARHLPDPATIPVGPAERRLYRVSLRDRARGTWSSLASYRADRAAAGE
jgi:hypothetical protein